MGQETSIFLLYVFIMLIVAFMIRSLLPSPHYYAILLMVGIIVFIVIYPIPNIYSAAEYSIIQRPMQDRIDDLEWYNEPSSDKPSEPTMSIVPKPLIISTNKK
jgi:hypothetical protein